MTFDPRTFVALDCETHLIQPGLLAPPLVCVSVASAHGSRLDAPGLNLALSVIREPSTTIVGAHIAYDFLVLAVAAARRGEDIMPEIFGLYESSRVYDIQIAEQLHAIGTGALGSDPRTGAPLRSPSTGKPAGYSLEVCTDLVLGRVDAKANDEWRLRYAELDGVPVEAWPDVALQYPIDDVKNTLEVALAQVGAKPNTGTHTYHGVSCMRCGAAAGDPRPCVSVYQRLNQHDLPAQVYTAWAMHLGAAWGFAVDGAAVDVLEAAAREGRARDTERFVAAGLLRPDGTKDLAALKARTARAYGAVGACPACIGSGKTPSTKTGKPVQCDACGATGLELDGVPVPRTDKGAVQVSRDALNESGDDLLHAFAEHQEGAKVLETYLPYLRTGVGAPLTLKPNVLLETGRTSYRDPIQQLPRSGGIRECFVARPGRVLCSVDYEAGELVTHAQSCLWLVGRSALADALIAGMKPHNALAARMIGVDYSTFEARFKAGDRFAKDARQAAKPANFGFPGGMGATKLVLQQRKQGPDTTTPGGRAYKGLRFCVLMRGAEECGTEKVTTYRDTPIPPTCRACIECAQELRDTWFAQWPENRRYFEVVGENVERYGYVVQHVSKRRRGGVEFTSAANGYFQGLLADAAKKALRAAARECYVERASPLFGSRIIVFQHDELIAEMPETRAPEAADRLGATMVAALQEYCPDLAPAVRAEPALMRRWYKGAEPRRDDAGRVIPWEPKQ
jgi:hypothetical protein